MIAINVDGIIKVADDLTTAAYLPRFARCWKCEVAGLAWLVSADTLDDAQRKIVLVLASEGKKHSGAGIYQLC